jgi:hypothetical protein
MTMISKPANCKIRRFIDEDSVEAVKVYLESDRPRGALTPSLLSSLFAAFLVSGCAAAYSPAPLPTNHPANPAASEAPPPPPSHAFRGESLPPAPAEEAQAHGPHVKHGATHGGRQ